MPAARDMTKLSWLGILLITGGLGLLVFAPQAQSCATDYDLTMCEATTNALFDVVGLVFIALGSTLAVVGLPKRSQ